MAERSKAHAWKACVGQPTVGSNPTLSARLIRLECRSVTAQTTKAVWNEPHRRPGSESSFGPDAQESCAPVAQLDRASACGAEGRTFESYRARQFFH